MHEVSTHFLTDGPCIEAATSDKVAVINVHLHFELFLIRKHIILSCQHLQILVNHHAGAEPFPIPATQSSPLHYMQLLQ